MSIDPSQPTYADHRPYIETVRVALLLRGIHVSTASFKTGRMRSAAMTLLPPDHDFDEPSHRTFTTAQFVELRWNEKEGWSLLALHPADAALLPTTWRHGSGAMQPPSKICTWLALLLNMPEAAGNRESGLSPRQPPCRGRPLRRRNRLPRPRPPLRIVPPNRPGQRSDRRCSRRPSI